MYTKHYAITCIDHQYFYTKKISLYSTKQTTDKYRYLSVFCLVEQRHIDDQYRGASMNGNDHLTINADQAREQKGQGAEAESGAKTT